MEFLNSKWDYGWFPSAYIYFGQGGGGGEEEKGEEKGKEEGEGKEKGKEGETGEVLKEGKEDEGEDMKKGKGGGKEENKNNILIIIIFGGRLTFRWAGLIYYFLPPIIILFPCKIFLPFYINPL